MLTQADWDIRHFVYEAFAGSGKPPDAQDIAGHFAASVVSAKESLRRLHQAHSIFLRPGSDEILMANPLSAIATDYRVDIGDKRLYANCAWDSLGIPAMLQGDASIQASHPLDHETIRYAVEKGNLVGNVDLCVHYAKPFRHWYDDIIDT